jgi:hypothetical protein
MPRFIGGVRTRRFQQGTLPGSILKGNRMSFNTAAETLRNGVDGLMRNVTAEFSQATDAYTVPVLRNLLFAPYRAAMWTRST